MFITENHEAATDAAINDVRGTVGKIAGNVIDGVRGEVEKIVNRALQAKAVEFWTVWYPLHRLDVVWKPPIIGGIRPLRVNDARRVFIMLFGEPPKNV